MTRRLLFSPFCLVALALAALTGCSHYQLGTDGQPGFSTLYIEPVKNKTLLPQAHAVIGTQLRAAFERDGRVTLVASPEAADATLRLSVRDYHRDVTSLQEADTALARKLTLTLAVDCTLRDRRTGQALFTERTITSQRDAFVDGGQLQSEYQTLPLLAEALAKKVAHTVLDVW